MLKHYHAFIEMVLRMPKIVLSSVHGPRLELEWDWPLLPTSASPR